jgi:hypothetical protein
LEINNKVVARYLDGRVLKGVTRDFSPNRPSFHIEVAGSGDIVDLRCRHLKALFFVRSLDGDSNRQDLRGFVAGPAETAQGRKVAVRFRDDEFICGYTLSWSPEREGFFLFPSDVGSNNQRIFVIAANIDEVKTGVHAEGLAQRVLSGERARETRATVPGADSGPDTPPRNPSTMPRPSGQFTRPPAPSPRSGGVHDAGSTPRPADTLPRPSGPDRKPPTPGTD